MVRQFNQAPVHPSSSLPGRAPPLYGHNQQMPEQRFNIIKGNTGTLESANSVIRSAVASWDLPERLKRLSAPVLQYSEIDLKDYEYALCIYRRRVIATAFWRIIHWQDRIDLHGLFTAKPWQGIGAGGQLQKYIVENSGHPSLNHIYVKAHRCATSYFESTGYKKINPDEHASLYPHQYKKEISSLFI